MAYVCMECYEIYDRLLQVCPKTNCGGEVVEIDDLMVPIITELNQKGYFTDFCCSGHAYLEHCYPYIAFSRYLNDEFDTEEMHMLFEDLPEPWELHEPWDKNGFWCIRCDIEEDDVVERQKMIMAANLWLLEFVRDLPDIYKDENEDDCECCEMRDVCEECMSTLE